MQCLQCTGNSIRPLLTLSLQLPEAKFGDGGSTFKVVHSHVWQVLLAFGEGPLFQSAGPLHGLLEQPSNMAAGYPHSSPRGQDRSCNVCYAQHLKPHVVTFLESYWLRKAAMVLGGRALHKGIHTKKYLYLCDINYHPTLQVNKLWHKQSVVEQRFECRHSGSKVHTLNNQDIR